MAKKSKKILARFEHPQLSNASKTLLANIRFASVDEKVKTIVVTSSEQNEGKTIVSTNLANAIATAGKKDHQQADPREPSAASGVRS